MQLWRGDWQVLGAYTVMAYVVMAWGLASPCRFADRDSSVRFAAEDVVLHCSEIRREKKHKWLVVNVDR